MNPSTLSDPLAQLRDLHLPAPISWWPPAPGWYLLMVLALILLGLCAWWLYRQRQQRHYLQTIVAELHGYLAQTPPAWADINLLLKRAAFIHHPRAAIAGLMGEAWLIWLDTLTGTLAYSQGIGRILLTGPYTPRTSTCELFIVGAPLVGAQLGQAQGLPLHRNPYASKGIDPSLSDLQRLLTQTLTVLLQGKTTRHLLSKQGAPC